MFKNRFLNCVVLHQVHHGDTVFSVASQFNGGAASSAMEGASSHSISLVSSNKPSSSASLTPREVRARYQRQMHAYFIFHLFEVMELTMLSLFKCQMQSESCLRLAAAGGVCGLKCICSPNTPS